MKRMILSGKSALLLLVLIVGMGNQLNAKPNSFQPQHPAYLHALSNLRAARWLIEHRPGNWQQTQDEVEAVRRIDAAIGEIKKPRLKTAKIWKTILALKTSTTTGAVYIRHLTT